jgi:hypothetical protein
LDKHVSFGLSKEVKAIQRAAREFANREILPRVEEDEKNHRLKMVIGADALGYRKANRG